MRSKNQECSPRAAIAAARKPAELPLCCCRRHPDFSDRTWQGFPKVRFGGDAAPPALRSGMLQARDAAGAPLWVFQRPAWGWPRKGPPWTFSSSCTHGPFGERRREKLPLPPSPRSGGGLLQRATAQAKSTDKDPRSPAEARGLPWEGPRSLPLQAGGSLEGGVREGVRRGPNS